jgi:hypothetical protein
MQAVAQKFQNRYQTVTFLKRAPLSHACDTLFRGPATGKRPASDTFATLYKQKLSLRNFGTITYGLIVPTQQGGEIFTICSL